MKREEFDQMFDEAFEENLDEYEFYQKYKQELAYLSSDQLREQEKKNKRIRIIITILIVLVAFALLSIRLYFIMPEDMNDAITERLTFSR